MDRQTQITGLSRRTFLATTSAALVGAALGGLAPRGIAAQRHPQWNGTLQFGMRNDTGGLDSHRHNQNHISNVTAAMYNGLTDVDYKGNIVPSIAESWEPNKELTSWVFRLRKGVLFHNGREVDAEAVQLNVMRVKDPAIGADWLRGAVDTIESVDVLDKYTVRINANVPDVTIPTSVMRYPTTLQAPDNFDKSSEHPIGTGPFKFVSWSRFNETRLVRFENYWETDAEGNSLPYLDEIVGKPKREDAVRLTALRTGQAQLIDAIAYADIERFQKTSSDKYNLWRWHAGGIFVAFNFRKGSFQNKLLRLAAAHAIDRQAIHHSVFYGQGDIVDQPYPPGNPWHLETRGLEYDPDKGKALVKQARAVGTPLKIVCNSTTAAAREIGQILQEQWTSIGFKVELQPLDTVPFQQTRKQGDFDGLINGHTYRFDPDDFFGRNLHSKSEYTQVLSGWQNARVDQLLEEAKKTLDPAKRKALYTEVWNINNAELAQFHLHEVTQTSAAAKEVRGYQPSAVGALTYQGGGVRTAYIAA
jgi:peptide/nickel transport system substrate-binding protein